MSKLRGLGDQTKIQTDYRGISLVELRWKFVTAILNRGVISSIAFHDFLHRFWAGRSTGNTTLKAKLIQQLEALREEGLYMIFLDLQMSYDALDRSR